MGDLEVICSAPTAIADLESAGLKRVQARILLGAMSKAASVNRSRMLARALSNEELKEDAPSGTKRRPRIERSPSSRVGSAFAPRVMVNVVDLDELRRNSDIPLPPRLALQAALAARKEAAEAKRSLKDGIKLRWEQGVQARAAGVAAGIIFEGKLDEQSGVGAFGKKIWTPRSVPSLVMWSFVRMYCIMQSSRCSANMAAVLYQS